MRASAMPTRAVLTPCAARSPRWRDAQEIQAYCDAAESAYAEDPGTATWVSWARHRADELDPLRVAPQMPALPEEVSPEELRPYLEGWNPHGPGRDRW